MSDIYITTGSEPINLSITETPSVVTLSQAVISGALASTVTVSNVVSVNVVTMPSITMTPAAVTTVFGTVTANTINNGMSNDPWIYIPRLTMSHPNVGNIILDGYYRFNGVNAWGPPALNASYAYLLRIDDRDGSDQWVFRLNFYDDANNQTIQLANQTSNLPDFPTSMDASAGTLVSGSLTFLTEQRESYSVRVNNSVTIGSCVTHGVTIANSSVTIAGTVTANLSTVPTHAVTLASTTVTVSSLPALAAGTAQIGSVTASISGTVPVSGTVTANVLNEVTVGNIISSLQYYSENFNYNWPAVINSAIPAGNNLIGQVSIYGSIPAGTSRIGVVTIGAHPSGTLTTRFGSVTTGGTSQLTSCVTNTNRKYLLCQNIDTATVTIGIGFSPTTTQGIQLAPGAGISFDAFCPTGAVWWLGATSANFNILEG